MCDARPFGNEKRISGINLSKSACQTDSGIVFSREYEMPIYYKDELMGTRRVDFLVDGRISVELKALTKLEDVHIAQGLNYLEAYNIPVGLLINFGASSLQYHRLYNKKSDRNNPTNPMNHGSDK
jgi:GxxExxY protein